MDNETLERIISLHGKIDRLVRAAVEERHDDLLAELVVIENNIHALKIEFTPEQQSESDAE